MQAKGFEDVPTAPDGSRRGPVTRGTSGTSAQVQQSAMLEPPKQVRQVVRWSTIKLEVMPCDANGCGSMHLRAVVTRTGLAGMDVSGCLQCRGAGAQVLQDIRILAQSLQSLAAVP
jgi:hypothetical protein